MSLWWWICKDIKSVEKVLEKISNPRKWSRYRLILTEWLTKKMSRWTTMEKDSRTKWSGYDTVRYGWLHCPNPNYLFILKFEERNRLKFNSSRICELCGAFGEAVTCFARKYTAYISEKKARIFHFGMHTCKIKFVNNRPADLVAAAISVDPNIKPSQNRGNTILTAIWK